MIRTHSVLVLLFALTIAMATSQADAGWGRDHASSVAAYHASQLPWHGGYTYQNYGVPMAMVVPPTASMQTNYRWGVPSSRMTPVYHQFNREYPGGIYGDTSALQMTPYQPSDTRQFGVYNVRGPWDYYQHDVGHGHHFQGNHFHGRGTRGCVGCQ